MNYQSDNSFHGSNQSSSYIQSAYSPQFHHQMYSHSQNIGIPSPQHFASNHSTKTNSIRYGSNSELSKRTRNQSYELSQDLQDKQIELLERKYGGNVRAQKAALVSFSRFLKKSIAFYPTLFIVLRSFNERFVATCWTGSLRRYEQTWKLIKEIRSHKMPISGFRKVNRWN